MNKVAIVVMILGALITVGGIALIFTGDSFEENIEEGIIYEGADGEISIDQVNPNNASKYVVHLVDIKYVGGTGGGYNKAHGNSTWNLTEADCDKVKSFSLGKELAEKIETGMVWVNTWLHRDLRVPFGGVKDSGVGREGGRWSLGFFSEPMNICLKHD